MFTNHPQMVARIELVLSITFVAYIMICLLRVARTCVALPYTNAEYTLNL